MIGRRIRWLTVTTLLFGLVPVAVFAIAVRQSGFGAPRGPHTIGRTTLRWIDGGRPEVMTDEPGDRREVVVQMWYPAVPDALARRAPYVPDLDMLGATLADSGEVGRLARFGLRFIRTHAFVDAAVAPEPGGFPVLIFSPGNATNTSFYTALIEELVSQGYVVAAIDHPYDVAAVRLSENRIAGYARTRWPMPGANPRSEGVDDQMRFARARVAERARDASVVLDQLGRLNAEPQGRFAGRLDLQRAGIFGHSLGGMTAGDACSMDRRFQACLNLDGLQSGQPVYSEGGEQSPQQPFMLITKAVPEPGGDMLTSMQITRDQWRAQMGKLEQRLQASLSSMPSGAYRVTIQGAAHGDFTDVPFLSPALFSNAHDVAARRLRIIADFTRAFFDRTMLDRPATLLDDVASAYPEVVVERYEPHDRAPSRRGALRQPARSMAGVAERAKISYNSGSRGGSWPSMRGSKGVNPGVVSEQANCRLTGSIATNYACRSTRRRICRAAHPAF